LPSFKGDADVTKLIGLPPAAADNVGMSYSFPGFRNRGEAFTAVHRVLSMMDNAGHCHSNRSTIKPPWSQTKGPHQSEPRLRTVSEPRLRTVSEPPLALERRDHVLERLSRRPLRPAHGPDLAAVAAAAKELIAA
jgi:hypothetical protein